MNGFDWVPFYKEMAKKLLGYRNKQTELIDILRESGVGGLEDKDAKGKTIDLDEMDPFTFLAMLNKQSQETRSEILKTVRARLGITSAVPTGYHGIPKPDARQTWLFPYKSARTKGDIDSLWRLYVEVLSGNPLSETVFSAAQSVKYAGKAKLTQAIFRAAPERFFPVDGQTTGYLARRGLPYKFKTAKEFENICMEVARLNIPLYELSHEAWLLNRSKNAEAEYQKTVLQKAADAKPFIEKKGGIPLPKKGNAGPAGSRYQRNPKVAATALNSANFKCEINREHQTFLSNAKNKPYVEAHHLIPFSNQESYPFSLDVTANIVALCPNCHRLLHHGRKAEKNTHILMLLEKRRIKLEEKKISISKAALLELYRGDLLEEEA